jgi:CubicO group peptidase (beta-lactamase class C family)
MLSVQQPQGTHMRLPCSHRTLLAASALMAAILCGAAASAAPPSAVLEYRRHMFDPPVMTLANRTIELMFDTVRVEPGARVWKLPRDLRALDFTYEFKGRTLPASAAAENTFTDALLIIKNGKIVHEAYLNRSDERTHFMSYSMAKSLNSVMLGFAIKDGYVAAVSEPVTKYVTEVTGTAYDGATLQDVLRMRSGSDWNDNFFQPGPAKDINEQAFMRGEVRYVTPAFSAKRKHPPGEVFNYNTVDSALIGLVVERAARKPISQYMSERLWKPAGMESYAFYVLDGPPGEGREFTGGGFNAVLRDYGRIGLMMLQKGVANRRQLLPADWVAESTAPTAKPSGRDTQGLGYAYLWWTIDETQAYTALGGEGQFIFVDPQTQTVIVKLSHAPVGPAGAEVTAETIEFLKAVSRWQPSGRGTS